VHGVNDHLPCHLPQAVVNAEAVRRVLWHSKSPV
jgi:hypothetical protein